MVLLQALKYRNNKNYANAGCKYVVRRKFETEESTLKATKELQTGLEFDGYVHLKQETGNKTGNVVRMRNQNQGVSAIGSGTL